MESLKKDLGFFIMEYNLCDEKYIENTISLFLREMKMIMNFWSLQSFQKKISIKIWDTIVDFEKNVKCKNQNTIACTLCTKEIYMIHTLSYKEIIQIDSYRDKKIEDFPLLLLHEFVHICHIEKIGHIPNLLWLREGLAITLSNQYKEKVLSLNCSVEDLLNGKNSYTHYYTLCLYILENYGKEYLLSLALNEEEAREETSKLLEEAKEWLIQKSI